MEKLNRQLQVTKALEERDTPRVEFVGIFYSHPAWLAVSRR